MVGEGDPPASQSSVRDPPNGPLVSAGGMLSLKYNLRSLAVAEESNTSATMLKSVGVADAKNMFFDLRFAIFCFCYDFSSAEFSSCS